MASIETGVMFKVSETSCKWKGDNRMISSKLIQGIKTKNWRLAIVVSLIAVAVPISMVFSGCAPGTPATLVPPTAVSPKEPVAAASASSAVSLYDEETIVALYNQSIPAVVEVKTVVSGNQPSFGMFGTPELRGQGSGFIVDKEGHILTNYHVIDGASEINVTLHDGETLSAQVVGTDRENDLALLKVDPGKTSSISPLPWGDSDEVRPGQMAIALGSPFGLEGSITVGVISGVGRTMANAQARSLTNMLETDAAINPGNSGGPLLDSKGEVIGINTALEASSPTIGLAIPINNARSLLPALLQGGEVSNPWLGISGTDIDQELASKLSLTVNHGVYVVSVLPGSPAEKAGLIPGGSDQGEPTSGGDIITEVDGLPVAQVADLLQYFNTKKVGDQVSLSIVRGDKTLTVVVTLGEWPNEMPSPQD
jgi:S1-C subfamily serine protease